MIVYAIVDPKGLDDPPNYAIASSPELGLGVEHLFLAGLGPGLLIGGLLAAYAMLEGMRMKTGRGRIDGAALVQSVRDGIWSLLLPVIILGGIYSGQFTPTQAAAVTVLYALAVEVGIHRSIQLHELPRILAESTVLIGSLLVILALAQGFNKYLESAEVAVWATDLLTSWELSPLGFLLVVNLLLLVVGAFMDVLSAIMILVPLLSPVAYQLGIHPMHLAVIFIVNLEIGYLTPPLGLNLFVAMTVFRQSAGEVIRAVLPFIAIMIVGLGLVTYLPVLSLGPVSVYEGGSLWVPFPERRLALQPMRYPQGPGAGIEFLAGLGAREETRDDDDGTAAGGEANEGRVMTLEEMMAMANQQMEDESMAALSYATLRDVLSDFRRVYSLEVPLAQLADFQPDPVLEDDDDVDDVDNPGEEVPSNGVDPDGER
jgi:C4-dicarboxylate transporter DctM subunit